MTPAKPPIAAENLRVLMLEDDAGDAALIHRALLRILPKAAVRLTRTRDEFLGEFASFSPQLVLSDYRLPTYDGLSALSHVRERSADIPFILISGTIGEELAVETLKRGATDYVLKGRLERLESVLTRALRERREREDRIKAEADLLESQTRLIQSQKMEALGRLSGGVAHDFNNILTAITGYGELALTNPALDADLRADIQEMLNAAFRAAALTRQLLAFSRRQIFAPKILDLNRSLGELDRMLQRIIGEDVKLKVAPAADLQRVRVDADQIGQVILNLVVNARDAMPAGGTLVLCTANVVLGGDELREHPGLLPGRYVRLSVEDTGTGMDAATLSRIYEPFFTTKSKDKGTGLGLATVYGIVKQSNGFIGVLSRLGKGTVFHVHLPAVDGELDAVHASPAPDSLTGTETILVVDDDAAVGLVARRVLQGQGYTVLEARGGEEALRLCEGRTEPLHLVVTDVVMSGMSGAELVRRLRTARPACKVLYVSGYADTGSSGLSEMTEQFLSKPFAARNLIKKVREILDAAPS